MPAAQALTDIEIVGMYVDRKRLLPRLKKIRAKVKKYDEALLKITKKPVNWNSPQQIAEVLFEDLGLPVIELTNKGAKSTKESVLLRLRDHHPIIGLIMKRREWSKKDSSFLGNYIQVLDKDDRVHTSYKVAGTVTGRLSSGKEEGNKRKGLNMQQVPRDTLIRSVFGAPPGWKFVEADLSQVEMRIAAHYSQDPTLMRIFRQGRDVHTEMAVKITNKPAKAIKKEERKKAKSVNFGYLFGMGWEKYITYAYDNYDIEVSPDEAKASRDEYFTTFLKLRPWHDRQRRLVNNYKQVTSLIGRTRHLPDIDSEDKEVRGEAERQAINSPVQGLASDLNLLAIIILHSMMNPKEARIVGTVHDSTLFEIRDDVVDKWVPIIKQVMENLPLKKKFGVTLDVPIKVDISVGTHWGEGEIV
jgi:DNA polymerase-1